MQILTTPANTHYDPLAGRMLGYLGALGAVLLGLIFALTEFGYRIDSPWAVMVLAVAAAAAERGRVQLERGDQTSSISNLPVLFTAVLFGPLPAAIVGAVSMLGAVRR